MNFISFAYAVLFCTVFLCRLCFGRRKTERPFVFILLMASALLYAWHIPDFLFILMTSAAVDYFAGLYLGRGQDSDEEGHTPPPAARKLVLVASLGTNLGLLFYFKYTDFVIVSSKSLLDAVGIPTGLHPFGTILPMGISFYTFASLSYTIDVYRRQIRPVRRFWQFFLFVSFFPHLVAGPIVRASAFLPQMDRRRLPRLAFFNEGCFLIIRGLFLKMVVADNLAQFVNLHWAKGYGYAADSGLLMVLALLFAGQIFCDFEGYTSIARGSALLLGYRLPENFNNPYLAASFKNFWERWHITLSQWLRDYLYIPLGGNRGSRFRLYFNMMIVMVLGGLWHGASLTFIAWGALHGVALVVERVLGLHRSDRSRGRTALRLAWYPVVQATVLVTWVLFRSDGLREAGMFLKNMSACRFGTAPLTPMQWLPYLSLVGLMHGRGLLVECGRLAPSGPREKAVLAAVMLLGILTLYGINNEFIYFQF
jgi:alginate O-acetyltransferase complex protein AlgI